jgi:alginate O-acetyltransferase complex protein AlgI
MLFNSLAFAAFLPAVLLVYYLLSLRSQNRWLLVASLIFYGWWDPRFIALLLVPTTIDYWCALRINVARDPRSRRHYLVGSVATNLTILGFFKYFNFFSDSAAHVLQALHLGYAQPAVAIILPVGISFYTFHEISYVVDVYRGEVEPVHDFTIYLLYVLYFPQLVAGPIARASALLPQLSRSRTVTWQSIQQGAALILVGYFKKVGVADAVAPAVSARFASPGVYAGSDLLFALYLFSIQIYCDFSGYTDIARGVSKLFGIELALNFRQPYFASSIDQFWRRWHMSLSSWLRDYLYIPLGGNRGGEAKIYRNLILTMVLGGLWHGASWTFVVWGALHGAYLSVHRWFADGLREIAAKPAIPSAIKTAVGIAVTFHLVTFAWIFFRADSFAAAGTYVSRIATWRPSNGGLPIDRLSLRFTILICAWLTIDLLQAATDEESPVLRLPGIVRGFSYATIILIIVVFGGLVAPAPFIYFQF